MKLLPLVCGLTAPRKNRPHSRRRGDPNLKSQRLGYRLFSFMPRGRPAAADGELV